MPLCTSCTSLSPRTILTASIPDPIDQPNQVWFYGKKHHNSVEDLKTAAAEKCELCSLFLTGLNATEWKAPFFGTDTRVTLKGNLNKLNWKEDLEGPKGLFQVKALCMGNAAYLKIWGDEGSPAVVFGDTFAMPDEDKEGSVQLKYIDVEGKEAGYVYIKLDLEETIKHAGED